MNKVAKPDYIKLGDGSTNEDGLTSINLFDEMIKCTTYGKWLIYNIMDSIVYEDSNEDGECNYDPVVKVKATTETNKIYLRRGYAELNAKDLVRRIKQGHYMINPNALIPPDYDSAIEIWDSAVSVTKQTAKGSI